MDVKIFGINGIDNARGAYTNKSYRRKINKTSTSSKKNGSHSPFRELLKDQNKNNKAGPIIDDYI